MKRIRTCKNIPLVEVNDEITDGMRELVKRVQGEKATNQDIKNIANAAIRFAYYFGDFSNEDMDKLRKETESHFRNIDEVIEDVREAEYAIREAKLRAERLIECDIREKLEEKADELICLKAEECFKEMHGVLGIYKQMLEIGKEYKVDPNVTMRCASYTVYKLLGNGETEISDIMSGDFQ